MTSDTPRLELPVRQGRNLALLVMMIVLTGLAIYVSLADPDPLGRDDWWVGVFPVLGLLTAFRLVRRRVPLALDAAGLHVVAGLPVLGLRETFEWSAVRRMRATASGLLLVDLKDGEAWAADRGWRVRANIRANQRRVDAAVMQPLRELAGTPAEIVAKVRAAAPVKVEAPEKLGGNG